DNFLITTQPKAFFDLLDDCVRVFFARIVGSNDRVISMSIHHFAHQRTLLSVAIPATAKNDNQTMRLEFSQRFENVPERIRRMRVIHENLKLSLCWNQLQASGHLRRFAEAENGLAQTDPKSVCRCKRRY